MKPFKVVDALSVSDASSKLGGGTSALLAGGTDIILSLIHI